jgi:hypothetical protein
MLDITAFAGFLFARFYAKNRPRIDLILRMSLLIFAFFEGLFLPSRWVYPDDCVGRGNL